MDKAMCVADGYVWLLNAMLAAILIGCLFGMINTTRQLILRAASAEYQALSLRLQLGSTPKLFWCGWVVPPYMRDSIQGVWPADMSVWQTGDSSEGSIWVGAVWAASAEAAEDAIRRCHGCGPDVEFIRMRWKPEQKPHYWRPSSDRFERGA